MRQAMNATQFNRLRLLHMLAMGLCTFLLAGCAIFMIRAEGTVVHSLPDSIAGKSFYVLPTTELAGQVEHNLYARDVAEQLIGKGMVEAPEAKADYWVKISSGVKPGQKTTVRSTDTTAKCSTPEECSRLKELGQKLFETEVTTRSEQLYNRNLSLIIIDRAATQSANNVAQSVYEAKVTSEGETESFLAVSRCVIMITLKDFPGKSGRTFSDTILSKDCTR